MTQSSDTTFNLDGVATTVMNGSVLTYTETFNLPTALILETNKLLTGSYTNACDTITAVANPSGGLSIIGTGIFAVLSQTGLFSNQHFTQTQVSNVQFTNTNGVLSMTFNTITAQCFAAGTLIETEHGARAVETLNVGDRLWAFGRLAPITWTGSRTIVMSQVDDPGLVLPIRVRRDALAAGMPSRDLVLSPDHALWLDGKLIPVRLLVNGTSIVQEQCDAITYHHVALERHDLILAESTPCESYLDVAGILAGDDASALRQLAIELPPAVAAYETHGYAPLCLDAALVQPVWQRISARSAELPFATEFPVVASTSDHDAPFAVMVDGRLIRPERVGDVDGVTEFACTVPQGARLLTLVSASASPWSSAPWLDDRRQLGVAFAALEIDGVALALDDSALVSGWHALETAGPRSLRWTNGAGTLVLRGDARRIGFSVTGVAEAPRYALAA